MNRRLFAQIALTSALLGASACGGEGRAPNSAEPSASRRPSDVYADYAAAIGNAGNIREVQPYMSAAARKRLTDLETLKLKVPAGTLKVEDEKIAGDRATVQISATVQDKGGKEVPSTGAVVLVREDGRWRVDQETWTPK